MSEDPYYTVKAEIQVSVSNADLLYQSWKRILNTVNSLDNEEFRRTTEELESTLSGIELDLSDLDETNPYRFKLDPGEVIGRRTFIEETGKFVKDMRTSINDPKSHSKFQQNQRSSLLNKPAGKYVRLEAELHDDNQIFIERESQQQQMIMSQQDNQLDKVLGTVTTLKELGQTMGRELENQAQMLDEIDHQTDRTGSKLQTAMGKMNKVIQNNADGKSNCCIIVLIIVLLVLLVLVVVM